MKLPPGRRTAVIAASGALFAIAAQAFWPEPLHTMRGALTVVALSAVIVPSGLLAGHVAGLIAREVWRLRYRRTKASESRWRYRALSAEAQLEIRRTLDDVRAVARVEA